jgi:hypothetical protein
MDRRTAPPLPSDSEAGRDISPATRISTRRTIDSRLYTPVSSL